MYLKSTVVLALAVVCLLLTETICVNPPPTETFPNTLTLQAPDLSYLYWKADAQSVTFEIHFKNSSKWFLFGLNGNTFSDVIVVWMNVDGTGHFSDRKLFTANNQRTTTVDAVQNWRLIDAFVKDDYTVAKFRRPVRIVQCDPTNTDDLDINEGNNNVVFASGNSPNLADDSIPIASATLSNAQVNILNG